jgi:ankyrin repeat protein
MSARRQQSPVSVKATWALCGLLLLAATPEPVTVADAAERGDLDEVRALLREGADPNAAQPDGMTALHWSALNGELEIARVLLFAGATVGPTTRLGGYTPLHFASRARHAGVARALLESGADPDRLTDTGVTALHFAAEANAADLIEALAEHGGDIDARDGFRGRTPLMFAAAANAGDALSALLAGGADPSLVTVVTDYVKVAQADQAERARRTRIRQAEQEPQPEQAAEQRQGAQQPAGGRGGGQRAEPEPPVGFQILSSNEQIGQQGGFSALHYAARNGHVEAARTLLDAGAEVDQRTADASTPMLVAIINGNYDLARMLLEEGSDPNLVSDDGAGPLFATLNIEWSLRTWYPQPQAFRQQQTSYLDLMELLLDEGADPNARTTTHIWYAAYNAGRMGVDFTGATPFWRAAYAADVRAMRLLVEHGADPNVWTYHLERPSADEEDDDEEEEDEEADPSGLPPVPFGGPAVHPLHAASGVGFGTSRVAQQHRSVPDGWLPAVRYLVEEIGVDPNLRDMDGYTAVHHAAARGDNETILYLVSQGADVTLLARSGQTTADMANSPEQRAQPHPRTVALLEKLGSKNNHRCRACG